MLNYWMREYTEVVSENSHIRKLAPDQLLHAVMKMIWDENLAKFDLAINAWAKIDPLTNRTLRKAINIRLDYIKSIFSELGFDGDELEMRTRLFVCYHSWESTIFPDLSNKDHTILQQLRHDFFMRK